MNVNLISDRPASASLLRILVVLVFGYVVMGNVVALTVMSLMYEGNLAEAVSNPLAHPEIRNILLFAQGLASLVGLVLIPWYYLSTFERRSIGTLFTEVPAWRLVGILPLIVITFGISISPLIEWNAQLTFPEWTGALGDYLTMMEKQAEILVKAFTANLTPSTFLLVFVVVAILPAVGEEFVFRGLIQTELQRAFKNPHVAIWFAAAVFSAFHLQFFGFLPRLMIGALLGYIYYWSGNLWFPVLAHFFNNGLQVIALYLYQLGVHDVDVESTKGAPLVLVGPAIVGSIALLFWFRKTFQLTPPLSSDRPS